MHHNELLTKEYFTLDYVKQLLTNTMSQTIILITFTMLQNLACYFLLFRLLQLKQYGSSAGMLNTVGTSNAEIKCCKYPAAQFGRHT